MRARDQGCTASGSLGAALERRLPAIARHQLRARADIILRLLRRHRLLRRAGHWVPQPGDLRSRWGTLSMLAWWVAAASGPRAVHAGLLRRQHLLQLRNLTNACGQVICMSSTISVGLG